MTTTDPFPLVQVDGGDWALRAACRGKPTSMFFPGRGKRPDPDAYATCDTCPVISQCDETARLNGYSGIWGGKLRGRHEPTGDDA